MRVHPTRRQILAAAGIGAASGLAGCAGDEGEDDTGETPTDANPADLPAIHVLNDFNSDAWQQTWNEKLVPGFEEETGIQVDMEFAGYAGNSDQRLASLVQAGEPPDLYSSIFNWVSDMWANDQVEPATETVENIEEVAGETISPPFEADGEIFHVPHGYYAAPLIYREDIYEELGLSPPEDFDELMENARIIDESDFDARGMVVPGDAAGIMGETLFTLFYRNMGVRMLQWADDDQEEVELWFPKEETVELLEYFQELAQYSPDPATMDVTTTLTEWGTGRFAQQVHLNMWPAGVAAGFSEEIARNTNVAFLPTEVPLEETLQSPPDPDGFVVMSQGDNTPGAKRFLEWLYGSDIERTVSLFSHSPMRHMPNYANILESDTFRNIDYFETFPSHLEALDWIQNEYLPNAYSQVPEAAVELSSGVGMYYERFLIGGEMMHQVLGTGTDPEVAYEQAYEQAERRLQEGKDIFN